MRPISISLGMTLTGAKQPSAAAAAALEPREDFLDRLLMSALKPVFIYNAI